MSIFIICALEWYFPKYIFMYAGLQFPSFPSNREYFIGNPTHSGTFSILGIFKQAAVSNCPWLSYRLPNLKDTNRFSFLWVIKFGK